MKILVNVLVIILCLTIFSTFHFYFKSKESSISLDSLRKQNDSLVIAVKNNNVKIDSIEKVNNSLFAKSDTLKNKLVVTSKKAEKYKKENEKNINYINSLSDNDIAELFTDQFK